MIEATTDHGAIRLGVQVAPGRARVTASGARLSPRVLRVADAGAVMTMVATGALLLGGDHLRVQVDVGPGAWLEVREIAGTVAYDAGGVPSSYSVEARVGAGGRLLWDGEPFVVADGAATTRSHTIDLGPGAVAVVRDVLVLGRHGEVGGALRSRTDVRMSGRPLLVEELDLTDPGHRRRPGLLGGYRVVDSALVLGDRALQDGVRAGAPPGSWFDLAGPGTVVRDLVDDTASSRLHQWWPELRQLARPPIPVAGPA
ncbi:urease accessory protein UreD [Nakamurella leprariae]|uniref:Urease accessory protein UreD n=1 Tax=Nakamurella leprariae TaxID=2803911 RepID=A0A938YC41_9ACTN|nr:urease accessory protein UreD [Nakamurella leprariae]MBM9467882.1 urease accessory protein UreD [Nakamurella leprariae]